MKNFMMAYCSYDPTLVYIGHRLHAIDAMDLDLAETIGQEYIRNQLHSRRIEYRIWEVTSSTPCRVFDTMTGRRL